MPSGPIKTPFDNYVADAIPNKGKKAGGANYDEYAGITPGDSCESGELGTILTSYDIEGVSNDPPDAGEAKTTFDAS